MIGIIFRSYLVYIRFLKKYKKNNLFKFECFLYNSLNSNGMTM